VISFADLQI